MFQIKLDNKGMLMSTPEGEYWMSPQRDIAQVFPLYLKKTAQLMSDPEQPAVKAYYAAGGSDAEITAYAAGVADFVKYACMRPSELVEHGFEKDQRPTMMEVSHAAGIDQWNLRFRQLFGACLGCVVLSHYFHGIHEAKVGSFQPHLNHEVNGLYPPLKGWRGLLSRFLRKCIRGLS